MKLRSELKPGQIGKYWLSKKPGRDGSNDAWCRTWYDERKRQTCRESFGTSNRDEAQRMLLEWVTLNELPKNARPDQILIEQLLVQYWEEHGQFRASARTIQRELATWQEWWAGATVSEISDKQREFTKFLGRDGARHSTIDKVLSTGRAALKHAFRHGRLQAVPHIFYTESVAEKEARPEMGRPLNIDEMACFIDAIRQPHLLFFTLILLNTMARSSAILELRRKQYDAENKSLALNPEGRVQTLKRRPTLPVAPNLQPWLEQPMAPDDYYVTYKGLPIRTIQAAWRPALKLSGLTGNVNRYSFRHGMARLLFSRGINLDDVGSSLGHKHLGAKATTRIYVPENPAYLRHVADTVEQIVGEIKARLKTINIDNPASASEVISKLPRKGYDHLPKPRQDELVKLLLAGARAQDMAIKFEITLTSVYNRQKRLGLR